MERELVELAQRGDQDAFEALVHLHADRLYGIAYRILRDPTRAEDALQNALVAIWEDIPELRDPDRFEAWTCRLVVRASYREAQRGRRWSSAVRRIGTVMADPADDSFDRFDLREELETAFRRLSPEHRAIVVLRYFNGLPVAEIADTLGIPVGTAASRLHYALRSLRSAVDADVRAAGLGRLA